MMERGTQYSRELAMLRGRSFIMTQTTHGPSQIQMKSTVHTPSIRNVYIILHQLIGSAVWRHKQAPVVEAVAPQLLQYTEKSLPPLSLLWRSQLSS